MGIDIAEGPLGETTGYYFDWLWEAYFNEDGCDTIAWWTFEYHNIEEDFDNNGNYIGEKMEPGMWDKDDKVIPMVTIEDLWNEVKDQRLKREGEEDEIVQDAVVKVNCNFHAFRKWLWEASDKPYENTVVLSPASYNDRLLAIITSRFQRRLEKYGLKSENGREEREALERRIKELLKERQPS
jgi:hypothetical protein